MADEIHATDEKIVWESDFQSEKRYCKKFTLLTSTCLEPPPPVNKCQTFSNPPPSFVDVINGRPLWTCDIILTYTMMTKELRCFYCFFKLIFQISSDRSTVLQPVGDLLYSQWYFINFEGRDHPLITSTKEGGGFEKVWQLLTGGGVKNWQKIVDVINGRSRSGIISFIGYGRMTSIDALCVIRHCARQKSIIYFKRIHHYAMHHAPLTGWMVG